LAELEAHDARATVIDAERADAAAAEHAAAAAVGAARRVAAPALGEAVTARLRELALPHAEIVVDVPPEAVDVAGEHVQFQLTANPGSPPHALTKVASGGELARSMLALRLVLSADGGTPHTLVFDEVDAGIGGTAATAVGRALAEVGRFHQVLVVTHLAQVAAQATTQVVVVKTVDGDVTTARARTVDGDERVEELARMLSGEDGGEAARRHAVELLAPAGAVRTSRGRRARSSRSSR
jgi:DNA repair protein RecN (Recombination protein N)